MAALEDNNRKTPEEAAYDLEYSAKLRQQIEALGVDRYTLSEAEAEFFPDQDRFWGSACHERPPLSELFKESLRSRYAPNMR